MGPSSERHPDQAELSLFDETEIIASDDDGADDDGADETIGGEDGASDDTPATPSGSDKPPRKRGGRRSLAKNLERMKLVHGMAERLTPLQRVDRDSRSNRRRRLGKDPRLQTIERGRLCGDLDRLRQRIASDAPWPGDIERDVVPH